MPKEVEIKDSTVQLMDPASKEFQAMLSAAQTAAVDKLAVKLDTTMVEGEKDVSGVKPASSAAPTKEVKEEPEANADEEPGDDIGNLKNKVAGLQAELTRVRKQKSGSADEVARLNERIADTEGQLKVLRERGTTNTLADKLAKLSDDNLADNKISWEDELADARVTVRLAEKDNDQQVVREANQRITEARSALKHYSSEERRRANEQASSSSTERSDREGMASEVDTLFTDLYTVAPDLNDKDSAIWKAGQKEYSALPRLMKALGPLGELVAMATAISKNPSLIGKKVISTEAGKVIDSIEKNVDKAFQKGGAAPSGATFKPVTTINSQADLLSFEEQVRKVKGG